MTANQPEAFSRILIDKALEFSGWDLLDPTQVLFELHTGRGRADYLLKDKLGRVLCVLEAKREDITLGDATQQSLREIWNGAAYRKFRKALLSEKPSAACANCGLRWSL